MGFSRQEYWSGLPCPPPGALEGNRRVGDFWGLHERSQVPFRTSGQNPGLPLRRRSGQGPHLAAARPGRQRDLAPLKTGESGAGRPGAATGPPGATVSGQACWARARRLAHRGLNFPRESPPLPATSGREGWGGGGGDTAAPRASPRARPRCARPPRARPRVVRPRGLSQGGNGHPRSVPATAPQPRDSGSKQIWKTEQ